MYVPDINQNLTVLVGIYLLIFNSDLYYLNLEKNMYFTIMLPLHTRKKKKKMEIFAFDKSGKHSNLHIVIHPYI